MAFWLFTLAMLLEKPIRYPASLSPSKLALWCYMLWYLSMAWMHFDISARLWLNSLGLSVLIGVGLVLSRVASRARFVGEDAVGKTH